MRRDIIKIVENCRRSGKITARYDIKVADVMSIRECCHNDYDLITKSFVFGYEQGYKAAMAEMKRLRG